MSTKLWSILVSKLFILDVIYSSFHVKSGIPIFFFFLSAFLSEHGIGKVTKTDCFVIWTILEPCRYRLNEEKLEWIVYVTDIGQQQHFDMIFKVYFKWWFSWYLMVTTLNCCQHHFSTCLCRYQFVLAPWVLTCLCFLIFMSRMFFYNCSFHTFFFDYERRNLELRYIYGPSAANILVS